jgi:hypothetical protein
MSNNVSERYSIQALNLSQRLEVANSELRPVVSTINIAKRDFLESDKNPGFVVQNKACSLALFKVYLNQIASNMILNPENFDKFQASEKSEIYGVSYCIYTSLYDLRFLLLPYLNEDDALIYAKSCLNDILPTFKDLLDADDALLKVKQEHNKGDCNHRSYDFMLGLLFNVKAYEDSPGIFRF